MDLTTRLGVQKMSKVFSFRWPSKHNRIYDLKNFETKSTITAAKTKITIIFTQTRQMEKLLKTQKKLIKSFIYITEFKNMHIIIKIAFVHAFSIVHIYKKD